MKCYWGIACLLLLCRTLTLEAQEPSDSLQMVQWYQEGVALKRLQKFDSARIYFDRVHGLALPNQYWLHYFKVEKQYARFLRDLDYKPFAAIAKLDSLIPLAEERLGPKAVETGELYEVRANSYNLAGQYSLAFQDYLQSLSIRREVFGNTHQRVAASYLNLAPLFLNHQQPQKAIRYAQLGIDILGQEKRFPVSFLSNAYTWQGRAYDQLGQYQQAKVAYEKAYQILRDNKLLERSTTFSLYLHQVRLHVHSAQYELAEQYLAKAQSFASRHFSAQDPTYSRLDIMEAELMLVQKNYTAAETSALKAEQRFLEFNGNKTNRLSTTYNMLGQIKLKQQKWQAAHHYFDQSLRNIFPSHQSSLKDIRPSSGTLIQYPGRLITIFYNQALCYHQEGLAKADTSLYIQAAEALNTSMAWITYSRSTVQEPEDRSQLTNFRFRVYELAMANAYQLIQASHNPDWQALSYEIAERSRANLLWESLQNDQMLNPTALPQQLIKKQNRIESSIHLARNNWFKLWQRDQQHPDLPQLQNELVRLQLSQDSLQQVISQTYPDYHHLKYQRQVPPLKQIQAQLAAKQQLLEYFYTDTVLYLLQIERNDFHIHRIKLEQDFTSRLAKWRDQLQNPAIGSPKSLAKLGHELYHQLIPFPIRQDSIQTILIIPDGPLTQLPFELLVSETASPNDYRDIPYLFEDTHIRYAYAAWTINQAPSLEKAEEFWAGFAPSYGAAPPNDWLAKRNSEQSLGQLRGAQSEVSQIALQLKGAPFLGKEANKKAFLAHAENYQVLHLALHAYFLEEQPMYSGLIFAEEETQDTLLLHEIYPLRLKSELAVLSACNTGVGQVTKGEGALSLAHAFAYAGCPSVLMSLWPVDDQSTQALMKGFYVGLGQGLNKSEALRQTRQSYLKQHDLTHPYYWGAFVLIGDDQSLERPSSVWNWWWILPLLGGLLIFWKTLFHRI